LSKAATSRRSNESIKFDRESYGTADYTRS
jgi:hypothetical protein